MCLVLSICIHTYIHTPELYTQRKCNFQNFVAVLRKYYKMGNKLLNIFTLTQELMLGLIVDAENVAYVEQIGLGWIKNIHRCDYGSLSDFVNYICVYLEICLGDIH